MSQVVAERKAALPAVLEAMVPVQEEMLPVVVLEFLRVSEAWGYWRHRGHLQHKCGSSEGLTVVE